MARPAAVRRLIKEYTSWLKEPIEGVFLKPNPSDLRTWEGVFEGPKGTPYEGGVYLLEIKFPEDYPFKMHSITVKTKIHHININDKGKAWLISPDNWSPALTAAKSLQILMNLVNTPDEEVAMSQATYDEWAEDRAAFNEKARMMRDMYAVGDIRDWYHLHQDPDWEKNYAAPRPQPQPQPATTSTQIQPTPSFSFGITPSATTTNPSTTSLFSAPAPETAQKQLLAAKQQLRHEYEELVAHPIPSIVAAPDPENPMHWTGVIDELSGTPYGNDLFKFEIVFSFGSTAPTIKVTTPIKHPFITTDAPIDIYQVLNGYYNPTTTVSDLLRGLVALMKRLK